MKIISLLIYLLVPAHAIDIPRLENYLTDHQGILKEETKTTLNNDLKSFHQQNGPQVVVVIVDSLQGDTVEDAAEEIFRLNKLGNREKDDGVLILISPLDRKLRIEVGYGLEGILTDFTSNKIIQKVMIPKIKARDMDGAIISGVNEIFKVLRGEEMTPIPEDSGEFKITFNDKATEDMTYEDKILFGGFIFGMLGVFSIMGIFTKGFMSWVMYVFMIPFWSLFPLAIFNKTITVYILVSYLIFGALARILLRRTQWYKKTLDKMNSSAWGGGGGLSSSRSSGGFSSSSSSGSSFSGGGGRSGGGGSSGSW